MILERAIESAKAGQNYQERIAEDLATILGGLSAPREKSTVLAHLRHTLANSILAEDFPAVYGALARHVAAARADLEIDAGR